MSFPSWMSAEEIMEFEYEYNRWLDRQDGVSWDDVNERLQDAAEDVNYYYE